MEYCCKCFYKILSIIIILICIALLILVNYASIHNKKDFEDLFYTFLFVYIYLVLRICLSFMFLISEIFNPCFTWNIYIVIFADVVLLINYISIYIKHKQTKDDNIIFIFALIGFAIDILSLIPFFCIRTPFLDENGVDSHDCFQRYFQKKERKNLEKIKDQIHKIKIENDNLKEENKKLTDLKKKRNTSNIEDKKIEVILWYVKNKYNKIFSTNVLYQYLLDEIKEKCGITIDKNKLRDIYVKYIQDKLVEYLTCPLTADIFLNPVITPEGQTFDKNYLLKELRLKGQNPLTRNKLNQDELIENKLVLDLCEILKLNQDKFKMETIFQIRKLLINPKTNDFYSNPCVIHEGDRRGETEDGNGASNKYSNKVISNIIEQNGDILTNEFMFEINGNNKINSSLIFEDHLKTDSRLNIK